MKTYHFTQEMTIKASVDEVFRFFGRAENLENITPPWLRFKILSPLPIEMKPGATIDYRLSLYGLPLRWQTEISHWDPPKRFVDTQRRGPYKKWIHTHSFFTSADGCLMRDEVQYELYGGIIGFLINKYFVRKDIERIFKYRRRKIETIFKNQLVENLNRFH